MVIKLYVFCSKPLQDGKLFEPRFGHQEVRLHGVSYPPPLSVLALFNHTPQEPFPLYPGESLEGGTLAGESIHGDCTFQ